MEDLSRIGLFLLGSGVLIFALTFLHLYITKIYPEGNRQPVYLSCTGVNGTTVQINAVRDVRNVQIEWNGTGCEIPELYQGDSEICSIPESAEFVRVTYEYRGRTRRASVQCYRIPA